MHDALDRFARDFPAGTVLFEEGQPGGDMYIVITGEVEIRRQVGDSERVLAVLPAGEFFGEMAILNARPRSATAVVRSDARLLVIDGTTFEAMVRARPEIALRMIRALATRLESANQHVELLLLPTPNHRVAQCLRHMAEEQLQLAGTPFSQGTAIFVPRQASDIAERVGLPLHEVEDVLQRLRAARLVLRPEDAGLEARGRDSQRKSERDSQRGSQGESQRGGERESEPGSQPGSQRDGFLVPEVGRLLEFLEFLNLKDRFGE